MDEVVGHRVSRPGFSEREAFLLSGLASQLLTCNARKDHRASYFLQFGDGLWRPDLRSANVATNRNWRYPHLYKGENPSEPISTNIAGRRNSLHFKPRADGTVTMPL